MNGETPQDTEQEEADPAANPATLPTGRGARTAPLCRSPPTTSNPIRPASARIVPAPQKGSSCKGADACPEELRPWQS
jgi:hypothetical protein